MSATPKPEPYRPSNGTEGEFFMDKWCFQCAKDSGFRKDNGRGCPILARALAYEEDDPEYPKEWVEDKSGPRCTAFVSIEAMGVVLAERARKAWESRRKVLRDAFAGDLFGGAR